MISLILLFGFLCRSKSKWQRNIVQRCASEPPASGRGTDFRQMRESVEKCWKGQKCVQREGKRLTLVTDLVLITAAPSNKTSQQLTKRKACLLEFSLEHWHDRLQKNGHYESRPSRRHRVVQPCDARMWRMRKHAKLNIFLTPISNGWCLKWRKGVHRLKLDRRERRGVWWNPTPTTCFPFLCAVAKSGESNSKKRRSSW